MDCEYAREHYGVPACIGRRVVVCGKPGVIAKDNGHYLGINFDEGKSGLIKNAHPTYKVEYLGMGEVRKMTRSKRRYQGYLEFGDSFGGFIDFCRWWDHCEKKERSGA